jgi:hypothetical protein
MTQIDFIATLASIILLAVVVELVRRRQLAENYSLLWLATTIVLLILSVWRGLLDILARIVGIFYPPAALFLVGFVFLLIILLQFSVVISRLSRQTKELTQQMAILNWKLDNLRTDNSQKEG